MNLIRKTVLSATLTMPEIQDIIADHLSKQAGLTVTSDDISLTPEGALVSIEIEEDVSPQKSRPKAAKPAAKTAQKAAKKTSHDAQDETQEADTPEETEEEEVPGTGETDDKEEATTEEDSTDAAPAEEEKPAATKPSFGFPKPAEKPANADNGKTRAGKIFNFGS